MAASPGAFALSLEPLSRESFLSNAFNLVDQLFTSLKAMDEDHPLAELLFEHVMSVRGVLNCWEDQRLHDAALEDMIGRQLAMRGSLEQFARRSGVKMEGYLDKNVPMKGWKARRLALRLDTLYTAKPNAPHEAKAIPLSSVVDVKEVHSGSDPEFALTIRGAPSHVVATPAAGAGGGGDSNPASPMGSLPNGSYRSLASPQIFGQNVSPWELNPMMNPAYYFGDASTGASGPGADKGNNGVRDKERRASESLSRNAPLHVVPGDLQEKTILYRAKTDLERQRWVNLLELCAWRNKTHEKLSKMSVMDRVELWSKHVFKPFDANHPNKNNEFLFVTSEDVRGTAGGGGGGGGGDELPTPHHSQSGNIGLVERFEVIWPQRVGKGKPRLIEIDLSNPHRMNFYKSKDKIPDMVFERNDFLDYRLSGREIELSFRKEKSDAAKKGDTKFKRRFVFPDDTAIRRFHELLLEFQQPPHHVTLVHQDAIRLLRHIPDSGIEFKSPVAAARKHRGSRKIGSPGPGLSFKELGDEDIDADTMVKGHPHIHVNTLMSAQLTNDDDDDERGSRENSRPTTPTHEKKRESSDASMSVRSLHNLLLAMKDSLPGNTHCVELLRASEEKSSTGAAYSHLPPLRLLVSKFYNKEYNQTKCTCPKSDCLLAMIKALLLNQGLQDIAHFLRDDDEEAQKWALALLWKEGQVSVWASECSATVTVKGLGPPASRFSHPFSYYIDTITKKRKISQNLLDILFRILVGAVPVNSEAMSKDVAESTADGADEALRTQVMGKRIREPAFIPVLLHSLLKAAPAIQHTALQNFLLLLESKDNCKLFLDRQGWQNWIFPLLLANQDHSDKDKEASKAKTIQEDGVLVIDTTTPLEPSAMVSPPPGAGHHVRSSIGRARTRSASQGVDIWDPSDVEGSLFRMTMSLFATLHYEGLGQPQTKDKAKYNIVFQSIQELSNFAGWTDETVLIARVMLITVLIKINSRHRDFTHQFDYAYFTWDNLFSLFLGIEEVIFYSPIPKKSEKGEPIGESEGVGLHLDAGGACLDFPVVEKIVDLLSTLKINTYEEMSGMSTDEKNRTKKGAEEFSFWQEVHNCFRMLNSMHLQAKHLDREDILVSLSSTLQKRQKQNRSQLSLGAAWATKKHKTDLAATKALLSKVPAEMRGKLANLDRRERTGSSASDPESIAAARRATNAAALGTPALAPTPEKRTPKGGAVMITAFDADAQLKSAKRQFRNVQLARDFCQKSKRKSMRQLTTEQFKKRLSNAADDDDGRRASTSVGARHLRTSSTTSPPTHSRQPSVTVSGSPNPSPSTSTASSPTHKAAALATTAAAAGGAPSAKAHVRKRTPLSELLESPPQRTESVLVSITPASNSSSSTSATSAASSSSSPTKSSPALVLNTNTDDELPPPPPPESPAPPRPQEARVLGDFSAPSGTSNVLNAKKNDVVSVLQQRSSGWWQVVLNGTVGFFPASYLALVSAVLSPRKDMMAAAAPASSSSSASSTTSSSSSSASSTLADVPPPPPTPKTERKRLDSTEEDRTATTLQTRGSVSGSGGGVRFAGGTLGADSEDDDDLPGSNGNGNGIGELFCTVCSKPLDSNEFYERDGQPYCEEDFKDTFCNCAACKLPIAKEHLVFMGHRYHAACLSCASCKGSFENSVDPVFEEDGKFYCKKDYYALFGRICHTCKELIEEGDQILSDGKAFHPHHFTCATCHVVLDPDAAENAAGERPYYTSGDKQYCLQHFKEQFARKCRVCQKLVLENGVSNQKEVAHITCVRCNYPSCTRTYALEPEGFSFGADGLVWCDQHAGDGRSARGSAGVGAVCDICALPVMTNPVHLGDKSFHGACLICFGCSKLIDLRANVSPGRPGSVSVFQNHYYHPDCLKCSMCSALFVGGAGIYSHEGRLFCQQDYMVKFLDKCPQCEEFIKAGQVMSVGGVKYHLACFSCFTCHTSFTGQASKFHRNANNKLMCPQHVS